MELHGLCYHGHSVEYPYIEVLPDLIWQNSNMLARYTCMLHVCMCIMIIHQVRGFNWEEVLGASYRGVHIIVIQFTA